MYNQFIKRGMGNLCLSLSKNVSILGKIVKSMQIITREFDKNPKYQPLHSKGSVAYEQQEATDKIDSTII